VPSLQITENDHALQSQQVRFAPLKLRPYGALQICLLLLLLLLLLLFSADARDPKTMKPCNGLKTSWPGP